MLSKFFASLHPKVVANALYALAANLAVVAGTIATAKSWKEAALLIVSVDGGVLVAYVKRADPKDAALIDLAAKAAPTVISTIESRLSVPVVPEPGVSPATPPPAEIVTPTGNIINPS